MQCASIPFVRAALAALLLACAGPVWAQDRTIPPPPRGGNGADDARTILQRYVEAWRGPDEMTLDNTLTVGFRFSGPGGGEYHAVFSPDGRAALADGLPDSTFHCCLSGGIITACNTSTRYHTGVSKCKHGLF